MNAVAELPRNESLPITLDRAEHAIATASNPQEINNILAVMDAAVAYAKRFYKDQQDIIQRAKALKLQAERKLGEILAKLPKATGALKRGAVVPQENHGVATLAEIGIDKKTSSRAQKLAALPDERFAAVVAGEIPVKEAIAAPKVKAKPKAKDRQREAIHQHKTVVANEGGTPLIVAMRGAFNAIESAGNQIEEQDKALAMARKLSTSLANFISKFEGNTASL